jgi:hypothetical protein
MLLSCALTLLFPFVVSAQTVWTGLTTTFTKATSSDHMLPANQDMLTPNVILTRGGSGGMINIAAETFFDIAASPLRTQWATDLNNAGQTISAANWQNLSFTNWLDAYGGPQTGGAFIANRNAVVRLVPDNVYLDLRFTGWEPRSGGGYSYMRAEPPAAPVTNGDYNENGVVDAADYVIWRKTLDQSVPNLGDGADGNGSGRIDAGDYEFWRNRFGADVTSASLNIAAVPEPQTLLLVLICLNILASVRIGQKRCC